VPKNGHVGNRKAVTKDTIWQRWSGLNAPLTGGLAFACLLSLLTAWFTYGAIGPLVCAACFGFALLIVGNRSQPMRDLLLPLVMALGGVTLAGFSGGLNGSAASAILWPILAMAGVTRAGSGRAIDWIGTGLGAGFGALIVLAALGKVINIPVYGATGEQSGIMALGVCAALTVAAIISHRTRPPVVSTRQLTQANKARDAALIEADIAREQNYQRAQFMAEMSHEIRTPLNAILGFADTMRAQIFGPLPQGYSDYPNLIHTSGTHLLDIVSDLLDLSKIEAGRYDTQLKPVSLRTLASEGVALSAGDARGLGVGLRYDGVDDVIVMSDTRALRQMIFNIVSNAIKFTPAGGNVTLRTNLDSQGGYGLLIVEDTGVGMGPEVLARIGQPWNQVSAANTTASKRTRGSGLGLALVKRLAELQGGTLTVSSMLGVGTKAIVALPLAPVTPPTSV
jgi:signal transduction histidine kinase